LRGIVLLFSFIILLFGNNIDSLLKKIEINCDLSEKTKIANGGVSFIFTRSDLERMQVNTLKDIIESLPMIEYKESSYGFPDPFTYGDNKAFVSNNIRVFINNQEIATGMYGSGFMLLGDMNLDFVDHIEVYFQNPSYEYTTESTLTLIKIYTKTAQKDNGGKFKTSYNMYNSKSASIYYANQLLNGWNYFDYFSYNQNKRKKYYVDDTKVSRDHPTFQALASIYNQNNHFLLQAITQNRDGFLDTSIDNTPVKTWIKSKFLHLGYDGNYNNLYILSDFDYKLTDTYFKDDVIAQAQYNYLYPIYSQISTIDAKIFNTEIKYKMKKSKNTLITGVKYRYKWFSYDTLYRNDQELLSTGNTHQIVFSVFAEEQYAIENNSIINLGIMRAKVINNSSDQEDDLLNYRLAHTYTNTNWIFKTIFGHTEFSIDPYLVNSTGFFIKDNTVKVIKNNAFQENIIFKNNIKYNFLFTYSEFINYLVPDLNDRYLLYNTNQKIRTYDFYLSGEKIYNDIDKLLMSVEYLTYKAPIINRYKRFKYLIRNINTIKKYDIFNELIFTYTNDEQKYYILYNLGIKYHYSKDIVFSIKGENIFDDAYKQNYFRADPNTLEQLQPTQISPIDRNIIVSMEYYF